MKIAFFISNSYNIWYNNVACIGVLKQGKGDKMDVFMVKNGNF